MEQSCFRGSTLTSALATFPPNPSVISSMKPAPNQKSARNGKLVRSFAATADEAAAAVQNIKLKVLVAAGGTGGHIYPAIAIADEIQRLCNGHATIHFVGTKKRFEWSAVPKAGYEITALPAVAIRRPVASPENFLLPFKLILALFSSWRVLLQLKPHVVVGTGGYIAGPVCLVAAMMRCPVAIHEQNAYAGITNRLLGRVAAVVFLAFAAARAYFPKQKCVLHGNPIRVALNEIVDSTLARRFFFHSSEVEVGSAEAFQEPGEVQVVLILGGSLGARIINTVVAGMAAAMLEKHPSRYVIWQTGPQYHAEVLAQVGNNARLAVLPYVDAMHMAYAAADLVVARAGAMTCSELLMTGKPSILIPSSNVAEDHQTKNAMALVEHGCSEILPERSLDSSALSTLIDDILGNPGRLSEMKRRALNAANPDAAPKIAKDIIYLAKRHAASP